ncbi:DUF4129 domain-containing protein [Pontibacter kalidii]|uniref:DUF4129 domain-containing protein n=1 Tax=Pontibacter kalidii TaxID=2592049 RepID=UPI00225A5018|nr:DUF4129 domain-containing protein [Pontibacter kalidii]
MRESFKYLHSFILILCLLLGSGPIAHAQLQDSIPAARQPVMVRPLDAEQLEAMRASEDFQYYEEVNTGATFWERLKHRLQRWLQDVFYEGQASGFWEVLLYLALAAAIVFIIIKMQNVETGGLFGRKAVSMSMPYEVLEENIHEMDMKALIAEATAQRDYRKAVRLHYLQSLKLLTDRTLIEWKAGKTNRSYISEIKPGPIRQEFEQLTGMFEYVWYGGAALGDEVYTSAQAEFNQFDNLVKQHA